MLEYISQPWPWYVAGPLIGLMVPLLLLIDNKPFGLSSSLKHICSISFGKKVKYFDYDWKKFSWNLVLVFGLAIGGYIGAHFLGSNDAFPISEKTITTLKSYGISDFSGFLPKELMNFDSIFSFKFFFFIVFGGFCVGFGTRYANGCTSGHAITGLSNLSLSSLIATCTFFGVGILTVQFILPIVLG